MVLVMTVEPGFGGQSFMEDMMPKVAAIRREADRRGLNLDIQVDGGISEKTIAAAAKAERISSWRAARVFGATDAAAMIAPCASKRSRQRSDQMAPLICSSALLLHMLCQCSRVKAAGSSPRAQGAPNSESAISSRSDDSSDETIRR